MSNTPNLIWPFVRQFETMLYPTPKNKLHEVGNRMYCGEFTDVPSRSNSAEVTLVLGGDTEKDAQVCFVYAHHEGTVMQLFSEQGLLDHLQDWIVQNRPTSVECTQSEQVSDWPAGLELLLDEVKRVYSQQ